MTSSHISDGSQFAELRSVLHAPTLDKPRFMELITTFHAMAPEEYEQVWLPYITGFSRHFEGSLALCTSKEMLEHHVSLLPMGLFDYVASQSDDVNGVSEEAMGRLFSFRYTGTELKRVMRFLKSPHLTHLEVLSVSAMKSQQVIRLASYESLANLRFVSLGCGEVSEPVAEALVNASFEPRLRSLHLSAYRASAEALSRLVTSSMAIGLKTLGFWGVHLHDLIGILAEAECLQYLEGLSLYHNGMTHADVVALCEGAYLGSLSNVTIVENGLGDVGVARLSARDFLRGAHVVELSGNDISDEGLAAMLSSGSLNEVRHLGLSKNQLTDIGARMLAESRQLPHLETLELSENALTEEGYRMIDESEHLRVMCAPAVDVVGG